MYKWDTADTHDQETTDSACLENMQPTNMHQRKRWKMARVQGNPIYSPSNEFNDHSVTNTLTLIVIESCRVTSDENRRVTRPHAKAT